MSTIKALALFSGGLDSILAARVVMEQGVNVEAVQFVTPFFNYDILDDIEAHKKRIKSKFGIDVFVEDLSDGYLRLLHNPEHGFGKNFNPCIDCKILMFTRAKELLEEKGASFLISGEVLGQRPMSQRRDTLNVIERDSETRSLLLRPLCAKLMKETEAEQEGWVDREKLYRISGRGRSAQIALAAEYGIVDYPAPAGGCILADPILSRRIKQLYSRENMLHSVDVNVFDIRGLLVGRQMMLPGGGWLIVGRDEKENDKLLKLVQPGDVQLYMEEWPGPAAILKKVSEYPGEDARKEKIQLAASLVVSYGKKLPPGVMSREVTCRQANDEWKITSKPCSEGNYRDWVLA
ncbi:MAG: thiamine biosynthesis protein [Desulfobacterales bacterium]|nr:MAG: thiamine biosynthesis protein [Desulfobacterales bacterium]